MDTDTGARWATAPVELTDGQVLLRRPRMADVDDVVAACQDAETQRWTTIPVPYERAHAVSFVQEYAGGGWASGRCLVLAITEVGAGSDRFAGAMDLRLDGDGMGDVGYAVAPWARGRGVGTAALRLLCRWGFEEHGLGRIEWWAQVGNVASRRMAEKVGFRFEGTCRARLTARGRRYDGWVGGLLPGELR